MDVVAKQFPVAVEAKILETLTQQGAPLEGSIDFVRRFTSDHKVQSQIQASWGAAYDAAELTAGIKRTAAWQGRPPLDAKVADLVQRPDVSSVIVSAIMATGATPEEMKAAAAFIGMLASIVGFGRK